jgi:hypothetical protein
MFNEYVLLAEISLIVERDERRVAKPLFEGFDVAPHSGTRGTNAGPEKSYPSSESRALKSKTIPSSVRWWPMLTATMAELRRTVWLGVVE